MMAPKFRRSAAVPLATLLATAMLLGCSHNDKSGARPSASASPTADEGAARKDVVATVNAALDVLADAEVTGKYSRAELAKYIAEPGLSQAVKGLDQLSSLNVVYRGRPTWTAQVTSLSLDAAPQTAVLRVCLDLSKSTPVDKSTGENLKPKDQLPRYVQTASAKRALGRWYLDNLTTQRTTPC